MTWLIRLGDGLTAALVVLYVVLAVVYVLAGLTTKATYWAGAAILTWAVLRMS